MDLKLDKVSGTKYSLRLGLIRSAKGQSHRKMATQNHGSKAAKSYDSQVTGFQQLRRLWVNVPKGVLLYFKPDIYNIDLQGQNVRNPIRDIDHAQENLFCHTGQQRRTGQTGLRLQNLPPSFWTCPDRPFGCCWLYCL